MTVAELVEQPYRSGVSVVVFATQSEPSARMSEAILKGESKN